MGNSLVSDRDVAVRGDGCSICGGKLGVLRIDPCYDCTYGNPLFWCYKHEHFSHKRVSCPQCLEEKRIETQKGMLIGL